MPRAPFHTLRQRLDDMLLTTDPIQRLRLAQSGLALVLMMLFRPAGILPSALRKRELETRRNGR